MWWHKNDSNDFFISQIIINAWVWKYILSIETVDLILILFQYFCHLEIEPYFTFMLAVKPPNCSIINLHIEKVKIPGFSPLNLHDLRPLHFCDSLSYYATEQNGWSSWSALKVFRQISRNYMWASLPPDNIHESSMKQRLNLLSPVLVDSVFCAGYTQE